MATSLPTRSRFRRPLGPFTRSILLAIGLLAALGGLSSALAGEVIPSAAPAPRQVGTDLEAEVSLEVLQAQLALLKLGLFKPPFTAILDDRTAASLQQFQEKYGLPCGFRSIVNGRITPS